MENKQPLLSLCIPIYNRLEYLKRMLERFLEDKILFEETIDLLISDNCSTDDLESCVNEFKSKGLKITYNRNQKNLGPDRNFLYCFNHAKGKYCWLLGSDDIPVKGFLNSLVTVLQEKEYGLVHLNHHSDGLSQLFEYSDNQKMVENIAHWITFMSSNIINTKNIAFINSNQYMDTYLIQVPYYLYSCLNSPVNAIYKYSCFEKNDDSANNGSYNLFQVFVQNLFDVYERFYQQKMLSRKVIENIKRNEYEHFLFPFIKDLLVLKKKSNFDKKHAWHILFRCYGLKWYFYSYPIMYVVKKARIDFCN
ncbi:glycosyltransferase family 2 protein [Segatella copri]|uniref:glycosyltransferase family 2 protein n=1 Tax=Segatella copri TaxID=165179 RepID=UPI00294B882C|nr:glycosyltransferase family 2 protein [Segatella copri]